MLQIAEALGKFEHEVLELSPREIARWVAYFDWKAEEFRKEGRHHEEAASGGRVKYL